MTLTLDKDGFLANLEDWNHDVAEQLAQLEGLTLTEAHWEIINATREFYQQYDMAPNQRPFVKHIEKCFGKEKGNSLYLLKLFPESPARVASRIAGLPRPTNCF
ncbi:TusE/DsrC/DsvC family sulfur relay protein [uncultured Endozoicomonas sp.]|uniref:TusE/DsrC/DsvC family sulfur relay protein n=1 Tax=uncultured Endozoicomonas sp. TaxID=432652 RepID=UPI002604BAAC|nr:TusE/DsrC/DsvC family sulfur relay protein [uncultured Endozoicomonas sp.]